MVNWVVDVDVRGSYFHLSEHEIPCLNNTHRLPEPQFPFKAGIPSVESYINHMYPTHRAMHLQTMVARREYKRSVSLSHTLAHK